MTTHPDLQGSLATTWMNNVALHDRFGVSRTLPNSIDHFREEVRELIEAAEDGDDTPEHVCEEAADVIYTAIGVLIARGIRMSELFAAIRAVNAKNAAKTHDTHEYRDDKIRRKQGEAVVL